MSESIFQLGGQSLAVVYWYSNETTKPDGRMQKVALISPEPVQYIGGSSVAIRP